MTDTPFQASYDEEANAYYFRITAANVAGSEPYKNMILDYDESGNVVGVEILPFQAATGVSSNSSDSKVKA